MFAGTVVELTRDAPTAGMVNGYLGTHAIFEVSEPFLGMQGRGRRIEIRTGMGGGDCGYPFQPSETYVVYAYQGPSGTLVATTCSRTARAKDAQADLDYLRSLGTASSSGYVFGIVGNADSEGRFDRALGTWVPSGIAVATVTLTAPDRRANAVTDAGGSFRFNEIPPGKYDFSVAKEGYTPKGGTRTLEVHPGGCAFAWETLAPSGGSPPK